MENIKKETFESWLKKHDWLLVGEQSTPNGRQFRYLTPSGNEIVIIYDLKGDVAATGKLPIPVQLMQAPPNISPFPLGFSKGKQ